MRYIWKVRHTKADRTYEDYICEWPMHFYVQDNGATVSILSYQDNLAPWPELIRVISIRVDELVEWFTKEKPKSVSS